LLKLLAESEQRRIEADQKRIEADQKRIEADQKRIEAEQKIIETEQKRLLEGYIAGHFTTSLTFEVTVPATVVADDLLVQRISKIVSEFNKLPSTIEQSSSIDQANSAHKMWSDIFYALQDYASRARLHCPRRVAYEWSIVHPVKSIAQEMDFTFMPAQHSYLNWFNFGGGLEIKITPISVSSAPDDTTIASVHASTKSATRNKNDAKAEDYTRSNSNSKTNSKPKGGNSAQGKMSTAGKEQAISRAAMCVYARWIAASCQGNHRAYCGFADGRKFGIARVRVMEGYSGVIVDIYGPKDLPGFGECNTPIVVRVLIHLLHSSSEELTDLMSPPLDFPTSISGTLKMPSRPAKAVAALTSTSTSTSTSISTSTSGAEVVVSWKLGAFLGAGGFGVVHSELLEPHDGDARLGIAEVSSVVIKTARGSGYYSKLKKEFETLEKLSAVSSGWTSNPEQSQRQCDYFPQILGALCTEVTADSKTTIEYVALKLSPRGISVPSYLSIIKAHLWSNSDSQTDFRLNFAAAVKSLIRLLGPAMTRALQIAHDLNISHNDVRRENMLIIPRLASGIIEKIVPSCYLNRADRDGSLAAVDLRACSFILNDWGETVALNATNRHKRACDDLKALVAAMQKLLWAANLMPQKKRKNVPVPVSLAEAVSESRANLTSVEVGEVSEAYSSSLTIADAEDVRRTDHGHDNLLIAVLDVEAMSLAAQNCDYSELSSLFSSSETMAVAIA
jgi:hypothetical protein